MFVLQHASGNWDWTKSSLKCVKSVCLQIRRLWDQSPALCTRDIKIVPAAPLCHFKHVKRKTGTFSQRCLLYNLIALTKCSCYFNHITPFAWNVVTGVRCGHTGILTNLYPIRDLKRKQRNNTRFKGIPSVTCVKKKRIEADEGDWWQLT